MILRTYQEKAITDIRNAYIKGKKSVILQLPTGAGKTVVFTAIALKALGIMNNKVLVITDRTELLNQAGNTFNKFGLTPEYLTARTKELKSNTLFVGMSETIKRRLKKPDYIDFVQSFNLIIIDECHKASFDRIFEHITENQYIIGATATPERKGKMPPLAKFYEDIISGPAIDQLIPDYLVNAEYYGLNLDYSKVRMKSGDFDAEALHEYIEKNKVFDGIIENYTKHCNGAKSLLFSASVKTSVMICDKLNQAGISSKHLDANSKDRESILADFKQGEFKILCNVGILTTGYDEPSIEAIILNRATTSLPLYLQMCGRGSRLHPGKDKFTILDFGGNIQRHDYWHKEREWSLKLKKNKKTGEAVMKNCPDCDCFLYSSARECQCGFTFPAKVCEDCNHINPQHRDTCRECGCNLQTKDEKLKIMLEKLTPGQVNNLGVCELEKYREMKGYKIGWVLHKLKSYDEFKEYGKIKNYKPYWAKFNYERYIRG